ncbi:MAG TPA: hypothetical protein VGK06_15270 [Methanosarcina sp.]
MKIEGETLECKSAPFFWEKELSYKKRNTVRSIRDLTLDGYTIEQVEACKKIKIVNTNTLKTFCRKIKDVSTWGKWVIISW